MNSEVYKYPEYYDIGYRLNTEVECIFLEACLKKYGPEGGFRFLDIGCGSGRHLRGLASKGYQMMGIDLSSEMVDFAKQQLIQTPDLIEVVVDDLLDMSVTGTYDAAYCLLDTFRCLLTNDQIISHLDAVSERLVSGGIYITDFWVPRSWDLIGNEIYQWEQTEDDVTVKVFYAQHPESADTLSQTFEDEYVFEVKNGSESQEIRGGRTRTRLILPQEFMSLVKASGKFKAIDIFGEFDIDKPYAPDTSSWRMITLLKKL